MESMEKKPAEAAAPAPEAKAEGKQEAPAAPAYITIDDFDKVKFVTAKVLACEAVPKSSKLLRFTLDCGEEFPRQILSGIHEWYEPEALVGKTVVACTNLKPRKMMGIMSNGMLISAVKEEPTVRRSSISSSWTTRCPPATVCAETLNKTVRPAERRGARFYIRSPPAP